MLRSEPLPAVSRRTLLGGSLAVAVAAATAGCRSATNQPAATGTVAVGMASDVVPANVLRQVAVNFPMRALVFDTLVGLDRESREYVPQVARSWSWNDDDTVLTLDLRDDVAFHTGRAFGPDDVRFNLETAADPDTGSQVGAIARYIESIEQTGDYQVTIALTAPLSNFLDLLVITPLADSETIGDRESGEQIVGTGPFVWESWTPGNRLELSRNPEYWDTGTPYAETVTLRVLSQGQAQVAALRAGEVDLAFHIVPRDAAPFAQDDAYEVISASPTFTNWYVGVNISSDPFTDIRVRQAVAWALDRERIADQVFAGFGTASCLPALHTLPGLSEADHTYYTQDLDRARDLLAAAGADGVTISLLANGNNPTQMSVLDIVQHDLESAGFRVEPNALDSAAYQSQVQQANVDGLWIGLMDMASFSPATTAMGNPPFRFDGNTSHVDDPAYADLIDAVVTATADQDRATANRAFVDYLLEQAFHLTVTQGHNVAVVRKPMSGVALTGTSNLNLREAQAQ